MYQVTINESNGKKTYVFNGKIDTTNSQEVFDQVIPSLNQNDDVVFDFTNVDYISSSGLRFILKATKSVHKLVIEGVLKDVYDVFEMTGFTQLIKVKKELRTISIENKPVIGNGYMGEVRRLDDETIVKVYLRDTSFEEIENGIEMAKQAFLLGIPTAIPYDVVKIKENGKYGCVYELINSESLCSCMIKHPENKEKYTEMYIDIIKNMLAVETTNEELFPSRKQGAIQWVESLKKQNVFDKEVFDKIDKLVDTIPETNHLVHGDCHIKNIMLQGDEPLLIDMDTLGRGHPIFEIGAFFLTYIGYPSTEEGNAMKFLGISDEDAIELFNKTIVGLYPEKSISERQEIVEKCSLLAYIWLCNKTLYFEKENIKRLEHAREEVIKLIDKYRTLNF